MGDRDDHITAYYDDHIMAYVDDQRAKGKIPDSVLKCFERLFVMAAMGPEEALSALVTMTNETTGSETTKWIGFFMAMVKNPNTRKLAEGLILQRTIELAEGEHVDEGWRKMISGWHRNRLEGLMNGKPRGRKNDYVKHMGVVWSFYQRLLAEPLCKREAIVADVAKEFGLERRRVFQMIEKFLPLLDAKKPHN